MFNIILSTQNPPTLCGYQFQSLLLVFFIYI